MIERPLQVNLSNWRLTPYSRWSFHHVRELLPSANIAASEGTTGLLSTPVDALELVGFAGVAGKTWQLSDLIEASSTDALLVAHKGQIVYEWYVDDAVRRQPHIVFSVSKSITAMLAGVMVGEGLLDPGSRVTRYIPELADTAYGDCTIQHVLDMTVSVDFNEDYLALEGKFLEYRIATGWSPAPVSQLDKGLHQFLKTLQPGKAAHGQVFGYKSPNSDLLGWIIERTAAASLASLYSKYLWQPMGAEFDAYITLDRKGAARSAGGFCAVPADLLRFAEMVRNRGQVGEQQVIPTQWIDDCARGGDREAWMRGISVERFPHGSYRNQWYQSGNEHNAMLAIGIHSQWIYIDPVAEVSIVKLSSQAEPLNDELGPVNIRAFESICRAF